MDVYVAVVSHHGHPDEIKVFTSDETARRFATDMGNAEGWENKKEHGGHDHEHEDADHTHEPAAPWLEEWGDDDGCGVVVGMASA